MSEDDKVTLARLLVRASLALPTNHTAQTALDAAVAALLAKPTTNATTYAPPKAVRA